MKPKSIFSIGVYVLGAALFISESAFFAGGNALADNGSLPKADRQVDDHAQAVIDPSR